MVLRSAWEARLLICQTEGKLVRTTILAFLIFLAGLVTIATGIWILFILANQEADIALEYYAMAIGMICGGLGLCGLAQALRLLLEINRRPTFWR